MSIQNRKTGWHYANEFNSIKFSNCCRSAITGGGYCPECGAKVTN